MVRMKIARWLLEHDVQTTLRYYAQRPIGPGCECLDCRNFQAGGKQFFPAEFQTLADGLAVESLLRAFRWTEDPNFEGRHNLRNLLKASGLLRIGDDYLRRKGVSEAAVQDAGIEFRAAIQEVIILWNNNLRFASEARLRTFLNDIGRLQGIRGDPLKKNALDMLNAAQAVIDRGETLWTSKTRS